MFARGDHGTSKHTSCRYASNSLNTGFKSPFEEERQDVGGFPATTKEAHLHLNDP